MAIGAIVHYMIANSTIRAEFLAFTLFFLLFSEQAGQLYTLPKLGTIFGA